MSDRSYYEPPRYALRSPEERERVAQDVERSQNNSRVSIAKEIRNGDLFDRTGYPRSYWHCLATIAPDAPEGRRGQWKAAGGRPSCWDWQDWGPR